MQNLRKKLFEIQKSMRTFAVSEGSEKKTKGKPSYQYTPGWEIVEKLRSEMDRLGVMLESSVVSKEHRMIEYPVYKEYGGEIRAFEKKEMYVTVDVSYTWVDVETGETAGPFVMPGDGANGTDKSMASALSLSERYFLLKYFKLTTREKDDDIDAHDSSTIPGGLTLPDARDKGRGPAYAPAPQYAPVTAQAPAQATAAPAPSPAEAPAAATPGIWEQAVNSLACFDAGTQTHNEMLAKWLSALNRCGYDTSVPGFAGLLAEAAQARREGRPVRQAV